MPPRAWRIEDRMPDRQNAGAPLEGAWATGSVSSKCSICAKPSLARKEAAESRKKMVGPASRMMKRCLQTNQEQTRYRGQNRCDRKLCMRMKSGSLPCVHTIQLCRGPRAFTRKPGVERLPCKIQQLMSDRANPRRMPSVEATLRVAASSFCAGAQILLSFVSRGRSVRAAASCPPEIPRGINRGAVSVARKIGNRGRTYCAIMKETPNANSPQTFRSRAPSSRPA